MAAAPGRDAAPARALATLRSPAAATAALTVALAALGAWLAVLLPRTGALLPGPGGGLLLTAALALGAALLAGELYRADVEVCGRSYSFSVVCLPLVLGLLYLPPLWVIAARTVAVLLAVRLQGSSRTPVVHAGAAALLSTALVATVLHLLLSPAADLDLEAAGVVYLAMGVVDVLMSALVLLVLRITVGTLDRADVVDTVGPASVTAAAATSLGLLCVVLLQEGPLGWGLLVLVGATGAVAYRGYLVLRRRHGDLRTIQGFIDGTVQGHGDVAASDLVAGIRVLLRAGTVRLLWRSREGEVQVHTSTHDPMAPRSRVLAPPPGAVGLLPATTTDPAVRGWLDGVGAREALVVDLAPLGGNGALVVTDRVGGEGSRFRPDDVRLAGTLAGHLVVRLRNTELVDRLRWDATHDGLTGLPNRRVLLSALELHLNPAGTGAGTARGTRPALVAAVLVMALDRLSEVNDTLGHAVGDQVLVEVARRLTRLPLAGATVARLAGEYFAVVVPVVPADGPVALAERLRATTADPVALPDAVISAGARVGIATADAGADASELLRRADTALAVARSDGRPVAVYERAMDGGRAERLALLGDLHRALQDGSLSVHYQPKLDLAAGRVSGVEALARWHHPVLGQVSPSVFVPLAESAGLVDRLTDIVLADALGRVRTWCDQGLDLVVSVNLSARSLDDAALPCRISAALLAADVRPDRLVLEITETSLMGDPERTLPVLHELRALGVGLSLDDFGTGYSSLSYLQRLPVDELKIDRSFVMALDDPGATGSIALVSGVLGLAAGLGLRVVAEGVESVRAMATLRDLGCGHVQGYLVSRAVPPSAVPDVVRAVDADVAFPPLPPRPRAPLPTVALRP